jgi:hypothetical protein
LCAGSIVAQTPLWVCTGAPDRNIRGYKMTGCGDMNGDGFEDLITISDGRCGGYNNQYISIVSGMDGSTLRVLVNQQSSFTPKYVAVAGAGDMNADGVADYAVCEGDYLSAWTDIRSGVNDNVIWSVPDAGLELLSDLDLDGDGLKDLVIADYRNAGYWGALRAYSNGGTLLYQRIGSVSDPGFPQVGLGNHLAKLGDIDGDGGDDFVVGCYESTGRGAGLIVSGRTGSYIRICYGELPGDGIGYHVSACGDLDADGYCDFAAGNGGNPFTARGAVRAFSSRTGLPIHQWTYVPQYDWAYAMASRGVDFDGDGVGDVVVTQPFTVFSTNVTGAVHAFSGRDGSALHSFEGQPAAAGTFGWVGVFATTLHPPAGQTLGTYVVANPNTLQSPLCSDMMGALVAYRGLPRTAATLGPACAGALAQAPGIGMASTNGGVRIHLTRAPTNSLAVLLLGLSTTSYYGVPLPASLDLLGLPGCQLRTSVELMCTDLTGTLGNDAGYAHVDLPFPVPASGQGIWSVSAQWLVLGSGAQFPGGMSSAIRWQH